MPGATPVLTPGANADDALAHSTRLVQTLREQLRTPADEPELIETHISWVLLAGEFAYKLKKPVRLGFLDFTTLESRWHFCAEELRLNARLAPELYLAVVPVCGEAHAPRLDGPGPVLDYAVKMHRLPADALAGRQLALGLLTPPDLERFAQRLARFHDQAAVAPPSSPQATPERIVADAQQPLAALPAGDTAARVLDLSQWVDAQAAALAPAWTARRNAGRVRECHGDLHLDNLVRWRGELTAFDCIEFDERYRVIDTVSDVAFLAMDLHARARPDLANVFVNAYLEASGDYEGLPLLRFYMVYRASVRAMVASLRETQGVRSGDAPRSADYLRLALRLARQADPRLLITHGLPGSGKSVASQQLATASGAIRVRSDSERRRLLGSGQYGAADTERVYARLAEVARIGLAAGYPTIVDAAFLRREQREALRAVAAARGAPFLILHCQAPDALLRERLGARAAAGVDSSEADEAVLDFLRAREEPLHADEMRRVLVLDAGQPSSPGALAAAWLRTQPEPRR
jgi:aminoglycoside phosphotransferase family enzyme/predicted kinase